MSRWAGSRGSATVLVLVVFFALAVLMLVVVVVGALISTQVRASQAADLAALAGARRVWFGDAAACQEASRIAALHGAEVSHCERRGLDLQVSVAVHPPLPPFLTPAPAESSDRPVLRATARAGPPEALGLAVD
mgnify:CR=1 FL=1